METFIQLTTTEGGPLFDMGLRVAVVSALLLVVLFFVGLIAQQVNPEATNHFMKVVITVVVVALLIGVTIMVVSKVQYDMTVTSATAWAPTSHSTSS